jgi:hypothetical protein
LRAYFSDTRSIYFSFTAAEALPIHLDRNDMPVFFDTVHFHSTQFLQPGNDPGPEPRTASDVFHDPRNPANEKKAD